MTPETTNEERNAAERIVRAMVADMDRLLAENAALRKLDQKSEAVGAGEPPLDPKVEWLRWYRREFNASLKQGMDEWGKRAAPQPTPEAGKLPSEEDRKAEFSDWWQHPARDSFRLSDSASAFNAGWEALRTLLSPAQPHDVPAGDGDGLVIGEPVEKFTGEARWEGVIRAVYRTGKGSLRYVVEVEPQGFQMIAVPSQLRPRSTSGRA